MVAGILYEEIKTGESLLATVHALRDPDGSLKGVLAMDSYTVDLAAAIAERSGPYASANSYILGPDGTVLVHREKSFVGRHYSEFVPGIELPRAGDYIVYRFRGQDKIAYASVLDLNGWLIISTVDRRELSFPAIRGLIAYALILSILIVAFSALESRLRTRALVSPLLALHRRVACIASRRGGTEDALEDYPFPDNEIGELAAAIEQLASSALLEKNRELEAANDAIRSVNDELQAKNLLLQNLAVKDFLTGIYNRRKMEETLQEQFALLARYGRAFSVILIDQIGRAHV